MPQAVEPTPATPALPSRLDCKCCGSAAVLDGYADLDRDCYGVNARRGQSAGVPVPYYRCGVCDHMFSTYFDAWTADDFRRRIYNDEYALFDPRFADARPRKTVARVCGLAPNKATRILDYGCGNGRTMALLREQGYGDVTGYDPFHAHPQRPSGERFDLVICVEVAEHTTRPLELLSDLQRLTAPHGLILLSTRDFAQVKGRWSDDWYVAPRNGHVSFYSRRTLGLLAAGMGRKHLQLDTYRHLLVPASPR